MPTGRERTVPAPKSDRLSKWGTRRPTVARGDKATAASRKTRYNAMAR